MARPSQYGGASGSNHYGVTSELTYSVSDNMTASGGGGCNDRGMVVVVSMVVRVVEVKVAVEVEVPVLADNSGLESIKLVPMASGRFDMKAAMVEQRKLKQQKSAKWALLLQKTGN